MVEIVAEPKMVVSPFINPENSTLVTGATRGNGIEGRM